GSLEDGRIIDTSLSRDPLQVELGKRQVIPGERGAGGPSRCGREKRRAIIPPHLAYGKRGSPPTIPGECSPREPGGVPRRPPAAPAQALCPSLPGDAVLRFEVELVGLSRASYWQKVVNEVLPLLCLGLVPALLGLIGYHLYRKASSPKLSKKKLKEEKRNKAKKK
ncbi:FKB11 isomerase, partial [Lophotis ruficrista]|nr:FKB11 isomerase [Lophotis ruficrista]